MIARSVLRGGMRSCIARGYRSRGRLAPRASPTASPTASPLAAPPASSPLSPAASLLSHPTLLIERQIEYLSIFAGLEQANRYHIYTENGETVGYMEEVDQTLTRAIMRQVYRLHRPFTLNVYNAAGEHALTIQRAFSLVNSHVKASLPAAALLGESSQEWHLWRRRYNLYTNNSKTETMDQFGRTDAPFLAFSFPIKNEKEELIGALDRNWVGLAREVFTDTGVYALRWGAAAAELAADLTLEQRAVMLSMAVSVDYDYFSRHSNGHTGLGGIFNPP